VRELDDVHEHVVGEGEHHRVALDGAVVGQRPPDLGQAPAQRPQRVVGLGEEQLGEPATAVGVLGEQEVGQQRPALATAQPVGLVAATLDAGPAQQPHDEAGGTDPPSAAGRLDRHRVSVAQAGVVRQVCHPTPACADRRVVTGLRSAR